MSDLSHPLSVCTSVYPIQSFYCPTYPTPIFLSYDLAHPIFVSSIYPTSPFPRPTYLSICLSICLSIPWPIILLFSRPDRLSYLSQFPHFSYPVLSRNPILPPYASTSPRPAQPSSSPSPSPAWTQPRSVPEISRRQGEERLPVEISLAITGHKVLLFIASRTLTSPPPLLPSPIAGLQRGFLNHSHVVVIGPRSVRPPIGLVNTSLIARL